MASLQPIRVKGNTYWRIVESRRIDGKPRPVPVAYLGKADDLLARLQATPSVKVRSLAHGHVAALYALALQLDLPATIDRVLATTGRRTDTPPVKPLPARRADGLSVGQSLTLAVIARACHPSSKRGFAAWAQTTTLGELAQAPVIKLTSQHFWDQMDQVPLEALARIEREVLGHLLAREPLSLDTLLFDATNFFTFIASTNTKPKLPARGKQKQKRCDLRQVGVALLCSRTHSIPLWHCTYGGNVSDAKCFAEVLPRLRERVLQLNGDLDRITLVYDKGNVSRANQALIQQTGLHYVTALPIAGQRALVNTANGALTAVQVGAEFIPAYRTRHTIWGEQRTVVVLVSQRLQDGQLRGLRQHLASATRWLDELTATLAAGRQRRDRARIQRDIETRLKGRQFLRRVLNVQLLADGPKLSLSYTVDEQAVQDLRDSTLGRILLITDRHEWSTAEIIHAYHSQAHIEAAFRSCKDPQHVALRPQHHWTDQKLHVHVLICMLAYLLARVLLLRAQRIDPSIASVRDLLGKLVQVRRATLVNTASEGSWTLATQFEQMEESLAALAKGLGIVS